MTDTAQINAPQIIAQQIIALAAGGTGGHMFPAEALSRVLASRGHPVLFLTDRRGETFADRASGVEPFQIRSSTMRPGLLGKVRTGLDLLAGYRQARAIFLRRRPAVVVGFGGYPSAPPVAAAGRLHLPVLLHEQNAVLGRANRMLARWATHLATGLDMTGTVPEGLAGRTTLTGNPVRPAIAALADLPWSPPAAGGPVNLLILGGSQGARIFSDVTPAAVAALPEGLRSRLRISQQCRPEDIYDARSIYEGAGVNATLSPFFTDVPERLAAAHLVICRSGASTVAEITAAGRPAILVPYPHAMDDHQTANARALDHGGAAWLMPQPSFTPETLGDRLVALLGDAAAEPGGRHHAELEKAAATARTLGRRNAAEDLADVVASLIKTNAGFRQETSI